jgi:hypothetical protein
VDTGGEPLAQIVFTGAIIEWRGPAPFYFVRIPDEHVGEIRYAAAIASYGWGCVPVAASIAGHDFTTSLFPRDGGYLVPLKAAVRKATGSAPGEDVAMTLRVEAATGCSPGGPI